MVKKRMDIKTIEVSSELADELERIRQSIGMWTTFRPSMDTVVKTVIQYYYLSIGFPISQWSKAIKGDTEEMVKIKKTVRMELEKFAKKR